MALALHCSLTCTRYNHACDMWLRMHFEGHDSQSCLKAQCNVRPLQCQLSAHVADESDGRHGGRGSLRYAQSGTKCPFSIRQLWLCLSTTG